MNCLKTHKYLLAIVINILRNLQLARVTQNKILISAELSSIKINKSIILHILVNHLHHGDQYG